MKQHIKYSMGLLLLGASLASCVEDKDYGQYDGLTYPDRLALGCWGFDDGRNLYNVNVTLNAQGDTVCNVVCLRAGEERTDTLIFSGGLLRDYSAKAGLAEFGFSDSYYWEGEGLYMDYNTAAYLAYQRDLTTMSLNVYPLYDSGSPISGSALASRVVAVDYPLVFGFWWGYGYKELPDGSSEEHSLQLALYRNGRAGAIVDGTGINDVEHKGAYSVSADGSSCDVRMDEETMAPIRLRFNAQRQLVAEMDGITFLLDKEALDNNQRPSDPTEDF